MHTPRPEHIKEWILSGVLTLAVIWLSILTWNIYGKEEHARTAAGDAKSELTATNEREATLKRDIADLDTSRGQETLVRGTLGVARPGEEVIIVVQPTTTPSSQPLSWWSRALRWIGL
jgi:cell division protein FtsB